MLDASLCVGAGAIKGWDKRTVYYYQMLCAVAKHYGFDIDKPFNKLSASKSASCCSLAVARMKFFHYVNSRGDEVIKAPTLKDLPNLERRYRETDSPMAQEELAKFLAPKPRPDCQGSRLRPEARHVLSAIKTIHACTGCAHRASTAISASLSSAATRAKLLKNSKEMRSPAILVNAGLEYLILKSQRRNGLRRRGANAFV